VAGPHFSAEHIRLLKGLDCCRRPRGIYKSAVMPGMGTYAYILRHLSRLKSIAADPAGRTYEARKMTDAQSHSPAGHFHAVVWIDHHEAKIFRFDSEVSEATHHIIRDETSLPHLHHKANAIGSGHVPVNHVYLEKVAADIGDAKAILIVGPSSAKFEFYKHLEQHHQALLKQIAGVETLDHPGDGPLLAHAAQSFRAAARMGRQYSPSHPLTVQ
jgi:hypothetical protein